MLWKIFFYFQIGNLLKICDKKEFESDKWSSQWISNLSNWNKPEKNSGLQLLKLEIHCDDHLSLSYTSAVHIWIISYTLHQKGICRKATYLQMNHGTHTTHWPVKYSVYNTATCAPKHVNLIENLLLLSFDKSDWLNN